MNILFYYPSNKRSVGFDTIFKELIKEGHTIHLLTTCEQGVLHSDVSKLGVIVKSSGINHTIRLSYYFHQIRFLIKYCKVNNIHIVFSHLQHANIIAVIAQWFMKTPVVCFRHHFKFVSGVQDSNLEQNKTENLFDRIINRLSKKIVVPSKGVYNGMKENETVDMAKVEIIPYMYDWSKYSKPDPEKVTRIRKEHEATLLLIMCSRLIRLKRHHLVFQAVKKAVVEKHYDIKMLVLDEGPEETSLNEYIQENNLTNRIVMIGYTNEFINYMAASDFMIHPSLTEASNSAVKEYALLGKTVAACEGVGDFDDYIVHGENGYLMNRENTEAEVFNIICEVYQHKDKLDIMGDRLKKIVLNKFQVNESTLQHYRELLKLANRK